MPETREKYRDHAIEAARTLLDEAHEWPAKVITVASALIDALEESRPAPAEPEKRPYKSIIAIDVDGPLHAYIAWKGATVLDGGPVPGAMQAIRDYTEAGYEVHIVSSRLHQEGGMDATRQAICGWLLDVFGEEKAGLIMRNVYFSIHRPPAILTIDDRAWLFRGRWPTVDEIRLFRPWRSYNEPPEQPYVDMPRAIMVLISGMVAALAETGLTSNKADEARVAVEEIHNVFAKNGETFLANIFEMLLKHE